MEFTYTFITVFIAAIILSAPILVFLSLSVILLGQIVAYLEGWSKFDGFYWSFITATTVGYGDIRPTSKRAKIIAIVIAMVGIMFTGIVVAITLESTSVAFEQNVSQADIESIRETIDENVY